MSSRGCRPTMPHAALTIVLIFMVVGCGRLAPAETPLAATRTEAEIVRVVDGDTIEVQTAGGRVFDVRLLDRRYRVLARQAADGQRGTWGSPCNGDFHSSLPGTQNGL